MKILIWRTSSSRLAAERRRRQRIRRNRRLREDRRLQRQRLPAVRQNMRRSRRESAWRRLRQQRKTDAGKRQKLPAAVRRSADWRRLVFRQNGKPRRSVSAV